MDLLDHRTGNADDELYKVDELFHLCNILSDKLRCNKLQIIDLNSHSPGFNFKSLFCIYT